MEPGCQAQLLGQLLAWTHAGPLHGLDMLNDYLLDDSSPAGRNNILSADEAFLDGILFLPCGIAILTRLWKLHGD